MIFSIKDKNLNVKIKKALSDLNRENIIERIWQKDFTVWNEKPDEISNRLGWLNSIETTSKSKAEIDSFVQSVVGDGIKHALLMGMGGSSLAPEVFRLIFGVKDGYIDLSVLDSTHPEAVSELSNKINFEKTIFIVSTKSGGTAETLSFMKYFFTRAEKELGKSKAGKHFVAITDPGSGLEKLAKELSFRKIFLNDPNIGGRYSALSLFGMVPAALIGVNIEKFLERTKAMAIECKLTKNNSAVWLGVILGTCANQGIDKATFILSPEIKFLGAWLEQLIAESTGKNSKGILPVDPGKILSPENYSRDRLFVYLKLKSDSTFNKKVEELKKVNFPLVSIELEDIYDLGKEYFRWEFATVVAGWVLGIQPFDQPNVESAKVVARQMISEYKETGKLQKLKPDFTEDGISVSGVIRSNSIKGALGELLQNINEGKSYVSIQAYLKPDENTTNFLQIAIIEIQKKYEVATTVGYGPRFLHSTGQLHKGDAGNGLFIQIISDPDPDLPIPDEPGSDESSMSFGILIKAQALGDRKALLDNNRRVITFDLGNNVREGLKLLNQAFV
jgi:glucose-6-phosphate isomerase